jgi:prolyl-tRNA synthetase
VSAELCVKSLVLDADGALVMALVRGDHELNEVKLKKLLGAVHVEMADEERVGKAMKAPVGSLGPQQLPEGAISRVVADLALQGRVNLVAGANKKGHHVTGLSLERDCGPVEYAAIRLAQDGDACPRCAGSLKSFRGIEVGHVFYLGTKYSEAMRCTVLDEQGAERSIEMGCYGIGVSRVMAAAIEQHHDENGICWPVNLAPFQLHILTLQPNVPEVVACAEELYEACLKAGVEVLYDDRDTRAGGKFKDADLIGVPVRVAIGGRGLKEGVVEIKGRREAEASKVPVAEALSYAQALLTREAQA